MSAATITIEGTERTDKRILEKEEPVKQVISKRVKPSLTEEMRRIFLNNTAMSCNIEPEVILDAFNGTYSPDNMYQILSKLGLNDERLPTRLLVEANRIGYQNMWEILSKTQVLEKLITRRMTAGEYLGYFTGSLPIGKRKGIDYFLSLD